jgi:hypothetical protein
MLHWSGIRLHGRRRKVRTGERDNFAGPPRFDACESLGKTRDAHTYQVKRNAELLVLERAVART